MKNTVRKIRDNHIIAIRDLLDLPTKVETIILDALSLEILNQLVAVKMRRLHAHWFSLSKRETYREMERKVS